MNRIFFAFALLLPVSAGSGQDSAIETHSMQIVGPSVLMNAARSGSAAIFDLREHGRSVPGATRNLNGPIAPDKAVFVLGTPQAAQQWAAGRGLKSLQVVPAAMIEFEAMTGVRQIEPAAAHIQSENGWPLFDVSEEFEFQEQRLPRSRRLDYSQFQSGNWDVFPRKGPFIVACRVGHRSQLVVNNLRAAGYDARNLRGGLWEWQCQKLPLESG